MNLLKMTLICERYLYIFHIKMETHEHNLFSYPCGSILVTVLAVADLFGFHIHVLEDISV